MEYIRLIPQIFGNTDLEKIKETARFYDNCGADELFYYDALSFEEGREEDIKTIQTICRNADIPLNVCAKVNRFEDVKKMIYAGAKKIFVHAADAETNAEEIKEAIKRFGTERIFLYLDGVSPSEEGGALEKEPCFLRAKKAAEQGGFGGIVLAGDFTDNHYVRMADFLKEKLDVPVLIQGKTAEREAVSSALKMTMAQGILLSEENDGCGQKTDYMDLKQYLKEQKLPVNAFETAVSFDEMKKNSDGMVPVITQDYKTKEVLMLAYMTKESFEKTVASGKMTYFSRSRQELWTKGETSGHYQYVKSLTLDCDNDTILAKVAQVGAACHTGNRTCFFKNLISKECDERNSLAIFEDVFAVISDRKEHPKEGSYTNYLFDKGIDKILKKVGEEATEIVIASKNPDAEELKYEICDFLYHMMVLMAERGITWKEITEELAQRH